MTTNSTHRVEVVPVRLEPHPNADSLSVVKVFDGYTVVVRTADWEGKEIGAYVPPDSVAPGSEPFLFLGDHRRIKVRKLRGVVSMGLLVPAPEGSAVGDDVAEILGVTHYDPPMPMGNTAGEATKPPPGYHPVFDVESLRRYAAAFEVGEPVFVTEKIHGANARFTFTDGQLYCGSRTEWKKESAENLWWRALHATPALARYLEGHPGDTVYGEVYGQVQDLKYGAGRGEVRFAAFDILRGSTWLDAEDAREVGAALPWVPTIARGLNFDLGRVLALAEGPSLVLGAEHVREGCVVKPMRERTDPTVGRVCMKVVGNGYMERA